MPHVSNKKLDSKSLDKIYSQLVSVFDTAGRKYDSNILLKEFLTETEKIMFAKRLAILSMIDEGISKHYISEILLVSSSTVDRISLKYEQGKYPYLSKIIRKNKETIWQILQGIIENSLARKYGKRRWAWLDEIDKKYNRKILKS